MNAFFVGINLIGLILNLNLYYIDIKYNDGVLDKVDQVSTQGSEQNSTDGDNKSNRGGMMMGSEG